MVFAFVLALFAADALALKIGYVDARRLIDDSPQARAQGAELDKEFGEAGESLKKRIAAFQKQRADFEKNAVLMAADEADNKARELKRIERELSRDQQDFKEEYNAARAQSLKSLEKLISEVVIDVAKRDKYDLIVQQVVYASEQIDLTGDVLKELEKLFGN